MDGSTDPRAESKERPQSSDFYNSTVDSHQFVSDDSRLQGHLQQEQNGNFQLQNILDISDKEISLVGMGSQKSMFDTTSHQGLSVQPAAANLPSSEIVQNVNTISSQTASCQNLNNALKSAHETLTHIAPVSLTANFPSVNMNLENPHSPENCNPIDESVIQNISKPKGQATDGKHNQEGSLVSQKQNNIVNANVMEKEKEMASGQTQDRNSDDTRMQSDVSKSIQVQNPNINALIKPTDVIDSVAMAAKSGQNVAAMSSATSVATVPAANVGENVAMVSGTGIAGNVVGMPDNWCYFKCKFCQKSFEERKLWKYHIMDDHGSLPYVCRYCDDRYEHKCDLREHEQFHKSKTKIKKLMQKNSQSVDENLDEEKRISQGKLSDKIEKGSMEKDFIRVLRKRKPLEGSDVRSEKRTVRPRRAKLAQTPVILRRNTQHKKNVVVVSVLDVMKRDAEKEKQEQKDGASRALLNIVDQIRNKGKKRLKNQKSKDNDVKGTEGRKSMEHVDGTANDEVDTVLDKNDNEHKDVIHSMWSCDSQQIHRTLRDRGPYKVHQCQICFRILSSNKVKLYHERGHPYPHECSICHMVYQNVIDLTDHEEGHKNNQWACRLCSEVFKDAQSHDNHRKVHFKEERQKQRFKCDFCNKVMRSKKSLGVHLRVHTGEKPYKCKYCDKSYRHYESWNYHENKHKGTLKQHVCQFCGKSFGGKYGLQVHERIHTGEKPFKCDHCTMSFSSNEKLKVHKDKVSGHGFICQFCGKEFFTKPNLHQHEMIHKGVKPHKCDQCNVSFVSSTSLKYHIRTVHTGERYPCKICNKQCKSKGQLTSHMRSHTDERPFQCKYCTKSFRNSNTLKTHEQGIHLGYRYTCEICKKDFSQKTALKTHDKLVHQGIKWKDLVQQRKINREKRLAKDAKEKGIVNTNRDTVPIVSLPVPISVNKAESSPQPEQVSHQPIVAQPTMHQDIMPQLEAKDDNKETAKMFQQGILYQALQDHVNMTPPTCIAQKLPPHHNITVPASLSTVPISGAMSSVPVSIVGTTNNPSVPDVAYHLATLANNTRHPLPVRQMQSHPEDGLQVHVPEVLVVPNEANVVDVVFPSDNGAPMYQTL